MKIFFFDTETTGLLPSPLAALEHQPRIVEFYSRIENDEKQCCKQHEQCCGVEIAIEPIEFESFIKPDIPIDETSGAFAVNRISNEMVKDSPTWESVADEIRIGIESCDLIVGHNVMFDCDVVDINNVIAQKPKITWPKRFCTIEQSMHIKGHRMKLGDLYLHFTGKKIEGAHKARNDVMALVEIYKALTDA